MGANTLFFGEKTESFVKEFWMFGVKQVRACVFAGSFFLLLFLSQQIQLSFLARYDFLFLGALFIQAILLLLKIETLEEMRIIFLFHILGFALEVFKTSPEIASWSYPEEGFLKLWNVPLYSGFMYSAVGSYISQAWHVLKLRITNFPPLYFVIPLSIGVYGNFFTHHFLPDIRWWLIGLIILIFWKSKVFFTAYRKERHMPLVLSFLLIGFFIWVAENISTYFGAWKYPNQTEEWHLVGFDKINSWFLLVIISFLLVATLHQRGKVVSSK